MPAARRDLSLVDKISRQAKDVDDLCVPTKEKASELKGLVKEVFDSLRSSKQYGPFSELVVDSMDADSIWEELQTRNKPLLRSVKKRITGLNKHIASESQKKMGGLEPDNDTEEEEDQGEEDEVGEEEEEEEEEEDTGDDDDEEDEEEGLEGDRLTANDGNDYEFMSEGEEVEEEEEGSESKNNDEPDEDFIDDMNDFLDDEEERYERLEDKKKKMEEKIAQGGIMSDSEDDFSEDDEDFVARELYEEEAGNEEDPQAMKYKDFYVGGPPSKKKKQQQQTQKTSKSRYGRDSGDSDDGSASPEDDEDDEDDGDDDEGGEGYMPPSKKEKGRLQQEQRIKEMEAELVGQKNWDMRGEVKGRERPENSLLEIHTDIERARKSTPMITKEYTDSLEEMIIKRITEGNFDDVLVPDAAITTRSSLDDFVLSQEKSRHGLGDIYAEEFMTKSSASAQDEGKEDENITNIKGLFHKICRQLDALSHFHYTPRPIVQEANVSAISVPSISLEDVTPMAESAATEFSTNAPERLHEKKRGRAAALIADAELTSDDKKRRRLASKTIRRKKRQLDDQNEKTLSLSGKSSAKYEKKRTDEILHNDKRVSVQKHGTDQMDYTKSSKLFSHLQEQTSQELAEGKKNLGKKSKGSKSGSSADAEGKVPWKF